ncbi:MAG: hypothetical protein GEU96_17970 [Propionibacteriales bacterium]|nr:hypothetical protein [Propionibacteriales bacterium]
MSNVVRPTGPQPPAVYWRRRLVVLGVALALVLLLVRWVGGDGEKASAGTSDQKARSDLSARASSAPSASPNAKPSATSRPARKATTELRPPRGRCDVADVVAVPDVEDSYARRAVPLRIGLSTATVEACTLSLAEDGLALEITSGTDLIWRSSACTGVLSKQSVVLRKGWLSYVDVNWSGRRTTDTCSTGNDFAKPGYYWAEAALIGGEPSRSQFELTTAPKKKPVAKTPAAPTPSASKTPIDSSHDG